MSFPFRKKSLQYVVLKCQLLYHRSYQRPNKGLFFHSPFFDACVTVKITAVLALCRFFCIIVQAKSRKDSQSHYVEKKTCMRLPEIKEQFFEFCIFPSCLVGLVFRGYFRQQCLRLCCTILQIYDIVSALYSGFFTVRKRNRENKSGNFYLKRGKGSSHQLWLNHLAQLELTFYQRD